MARRISGERSIKICDKSYTLRLSFDTLEEIEDKYGSLLTLFNTKKLMKLTVLYFIFAKMANVGSQKAMDICINGDFGAISEAIGDVISATLNPEKKTGGKKSGNVKARKG